MKKIFIDIGHGGKDGGAGNNNLLEKDMNLVTGLALGERLEENGFSVMYSRTDDRFIDLSPRANMANSWGADLFVSCHYNAGGGDRGEVIHSVSGGIGQKVAECIANKLKEIGQGEVRVYSKRGQNGDYFAVIRETAMPAVIVEPCFIDNESDRTLADTGDKQKDVGIAIARGILDYYGVSEKMSNTDQNNGNRPDKLSYDETVDNMIKDGVTTIENMAAWEQKLAGNSPINPEEARAIFDRYHQKLKGNG